MTIVTIAWLYVTVMMAAAEATSSHGTLLGAGVTFVLYGALPLVIVRYIMGTPARKRARQAMEAAAARDASADTAADADQAAGSLVPRQPDAGGHATADTITPMRKEP